MTTPAVPGVALVTAGRLLERRVGLRIAPSVTARLARLMAEEAGAHDLDLSTYSARLETDSALLQGLVDRITVQETSFFRDPGQLEAFRSHVLPGLGPRVRIWSAGCSNGQEPYTLAMILAEHGVADWQVTATDVSTTALVRTRRARYSAKEMQGVPPPLRARYFRPSGTEWEVAGELRDRVRVLSGNVVADPPPFGVGQCDVVFCRNVLIYLGHDAMVAAVEQWARLLRPPGWLFLGYSESLSQLTDTFEPARLGAGFAYRLAPSAPGLADAKQVHAETSRRNRRSSSRANEDRSRKAGGSTPEPGRRGRPEKPRVPAPPVEPAALLAAGQEAMDAGDFSAAVVAYRKYAYLEPDRMVAHLRLGLALEASGDAVAARRAFEAARHAPDRGSAGEVVATSHNADDLARLLDRKFAPR